METHAALVSWAFINASGLLLDPPSPGQVHPNQRHRRGARTVAKASHFAAGANAVDGAGSQRKRRTHTASPWRTASHCHPNRQKLGGQRPANGSCDDCELLSQSLLAALTHEQIRTTHNVGTYHDDGSTCCASRKRITGRTYIRILSRHISPSDDIADVLDRVMTLVPTDVAYLRHLVPYPRLARPPSDFDFPTRGYGFKPLPKAPILSAMRVRVALRRACETRARGLQECV